MKSVSEPYARIWMSRASFIKDDGQETFREADETCVFSWREGGDEQFGTEHMYKFWIKPMAFRQNIGQGRESLSLARGSLLLHWMKQGLDQLPDASSSQTVHRFSIGHVGTFEHHQVNHSEKELSRSLDVLVDGTQRPSLCHTQTIDRAWRTLKKDIPFNSDAKTVDKQIALDLHVCTAQRQLCVVGQDRWKAFCNVLPLFKKYLSDVGGVPPDVVKGARKELQVVEAEPGT